MTGIYKPRLGRLKLSTSTRTLAVCLTAAGVSLSTTPAAFAAGSVDNTALASGSYTDSGGGTTTVDSLTDDATVPLADPTLDLTVVKTGTLNPNVVGDGDLEAGDTISFTIDVTNNSNVTLTNVQPQTDTLTFDGNASTNAVPALSPASVASLAPGGTQQFTVTYTLDDLDILNAADVTDGVENVIVMEAESPGPGGTTTPVTGTDTSTNTIAADPELVVTKTAVLTEINGNTGDSLAEIGDTIAYTYVVQNTGNVAIDNVTINDVHEGAAIAAGLILEDETTLVDGPLANSADTSVGGGAAADGTWDLLAAGATVTFTYTHTVTSAEFANQ